MSLLAKPSVAFVGSRDHSTYGAEAARILASAVAQRAVIVSGMARGIDAIAHAAALDAGDRKSTRLNSSHGYISYAVFCLKKKNRLRRGCIVEKDAPDKQRSEPIRN